MIARGDRKAVEPMSTTSTLDVDRTTALTYFLRYLAGNPDGDSAVRALALGALAPFATASAVVYAQARTRNLEIVGSYGVVDEFSSGLRTVPTETPVPICDAFTSMQSFTLTPTDLLTRYPILQSEPRLHDGDALPPDGGHLVFAPVVNSGVAVGAIALVQMTPTEWGSAEWQYLDGVLAGLSIWMVAQREVLVDRWRRAAPPQRDVRVSERQREVLEMISLDRTNREIARALGYSVPTIKKDLQQLMKLLGTHDRRSTAGRAREIGLLPERRGAPTSLDA